MIRLPFNVGDSLRINYPSRDNLLVGLLYNYSDNTSEIKENEIIHLRVNFHPSENLSGKIWRKKIEFELSNGPDIAFLNNDFPEIGKTIFLTYEEAYE